ncbi:MAG: winged helix-turn-helix domain-containing protein [Bacilli bacterium]|nr:winged helix-turn-helix domain-containing protein [Bacilli bacterium]
MQPKVKYEYENTKSGFKFTFYRPLGQKYVQDMSETEIKVLKEIKKNNYARISEIAKAIEKSDKTVSRAIKK